MHPDLAAKGKRVTKIFWAIVVAVALLFSAGMFYASRWLSPANLISNLNSTNEARKRWYTDLLINKGVSRAGHSLIAAVENPNEDRERRRVCIYILGEIHHTGAERQLVALMKDEDMVLAGQAAFALGRIGDPAVLDDLLGAYDAAPQGLRLRILAALGELGDARAITALEAAAHAGDALTRDTAKVALQKVKEKQPG